MMRGALPTAFISSASSTPIARVITAVTRQKAIDLATTVQNCGLVASSM